MECSSGVKPTITGATALLWASGLRRRPIDCASIVRNGLSNGDGVYTIALRGRRQPP